MMMAPPQVGSPFDGLPPSETRHRAFFTAASGSSQSTFSSPAPSAPSARSGHAMVYCKHLHCAFMCGGLGFGNNVKNDVWKFDMTTEEWSRVATTGPGPKPSFGAGHVLLSDDRRWFFYGGLGMHDVHLSCVRVLDLDTMVWSRVPQLCTHAGDRLRRVWGHKISSVTLNGKGKLIIFGGMEGNDTNDDIYVIDEATLRLEASLSVTGSQMTSRDHVRSNVKSRRCHGACTYRDVFIFIVGGRDHQHFFNDMWCYNALLNEWIPVTEYASPQDMQTYFDNPILAEPGRQIRQKYAMAVSRHAGLQPPSSLLSSMCPRTGVSMVISGEYLYVTGGFLFFLFGSTNFNDMHVYSIRDHHWENVQLPRNSLAGGVDDDVLTPTSIPATFDVSARLQVAGEYGCDVPKPFTMASLVEWPLSPGHPSQRQGSQAIGTQWLLFGGRMGDHPRAAQYRVRIFEPWRPLTWLAASWLNRHATPSDISSITNRCVSMVKSFQAPHVFSVVIPTQITPHDIMEALHEGPTTTDPELDDVIVHLEAAGSSDDDEEPDDDDDAMWEDVEDGDDDEDGFDDDDNAGGS